MTRAIGFIRLNFFLVLNCDKGWGWFFWLLKFARFRHRLSQIFCWISMRRAHRYIRLLNCILQLNWNCLSSILIILPTLPRTILYPKILLTLQHLLLRRLLLRQVILRYSHWLMSILTLQWNKSSLIRSSLTLEIAYIRQLFMMVFNWDSCLVVEIEFLDVVVDVLDLFRLLLLRFGWEGFETVLVAALDTQKLLYFWSVMDW